MERGLKKALELLRRKRRRPVGPARRSLAEQFALFQQILRLNNRILDKIADMGAKLGGSYIFDRHYIHTASEELADMVERMITALNNMSGNRYMELYDAFRAIEQQIRAELEGRVVVPETGYILPYSELGAEFAEAVGGKNANLGEIRNALGLKVPEGFAVTTAAYQAFMEHGGLDEKIKEVLARWEEGDLDDEAAEKEIAGIIMSAPFPPKLERELLRAAERLVRHAPMPLVVVRSSALGEDGEESFAGLFDTRVGVRPEGVPRAYRQVVASLFCAPALVYRKQRALELHELMMAVGCQVLIPAKASGVLYTRDPANVHKEVMLVGALWGLGEPLVGGEATGDTYTISRTPPHRALALKVVRKPRRLVPRPEGGLKWEDVPPKMQTMGCLGPEELKVLGATGLKLEKHFRRPQDVEWVLDEEGEIWIVQSRPLQLAADRQDLAGDIAEVLRSYPVIFHGKGSVVQGGIAAGRVFVVRTDEDMERFPEGAVLVTRRSSPRLARILRKAAAVLTDLGSPTGHMATIARELRVPTIVGTEVATKLLHTGQEVTVDATQNVVYQGLVKELEYYHLTEESFEDMYEYRLLRRILRRIAPLNLIDASSRDFTPANCTTYHDIVRFIHEKAVAELISHHGLNGTSPQRGKRLKCSVPLDIVIIDIGGGLSPDAHGPEVVPSQLRSLPMKAFVEGLARPGFWSTESVPVDFKAFMSSLTRTFSFNVASPSYVGQNLAVISREYANITLRLGYHFTMIDAYITPVANDNHAYFRFLGGVTDMVRRSRRARLLERILTDHDFRVETRGDLVVARIKKLPMEMMLEKMRLLGCLVGFTRQLDVKMVRDEAVEEAVEEFNGLYESCGPPGPAPQGRDDGHAGQEDECVDS